MRDITYAQSIREAMTEEMHRDSSVFLIGEDIGVYGGAFGISLGMIDIFGKERIIDTPISESAIMGAAVGAAMTGMRPIVEIQFSDFLTIAMDQLVNQAAKIRYMFGGQVSIPLVVRSPSGSGTGAAGQHSQALEAWFAHIPGLKVVIPSNPYDAKGLLKEAIHDNNPVVFLEQKTLYRSIGNVPEEDYTKKFTAEVKKQGTDISIISYGRMLPMCLNVAEQLEKEFSIQVIDVISLRPLDTNTIINAVSQTGRVIIVHEAVLRGGFGAEISSVITESESFFYLQAPIRRLGGSDTPIPYNKNLEAHCIPSQNDLIKAIHELMAY